MCVCVYVCVCVCAVVQLNKPYVWSTSSSEKRDHEAMRYEFLYLLHSLYNGLAHLHQYTSTENQRGWPNPRVWSASPVVWGAPRSAVFWSARLGRFLPQLWRSPPASGSHPTRLLLPYRELGLLPGAWGTLNKKNADGAEGIFGNAGRVWVTALRPDPHLKRPCAELARSVGRIRDNRPNPRDTITCDTTCVVDK